MRCISPLRLRINGTLQDVPCGKCNFCLMSRRADWTFRISQEAKLHVLQDFVTLTYDDDHLPFLMEDGSTVVGVDKVIGSVGLTFQASLMKSDLQNFMKRLRKLVSPAKLRYYAVGEYGTRGGRPHYHIILFGLPKHVDLAQVWGNGHVRRDHVSPASIHYVTKYHVNRYGDSAGREPPFVLCLRSRA